MDHDILVSLVRPQPTEVKPDVLLSGLLEVYNPFPGQCLTGIWALTDVTQIRAPSGVPARAGPDVSGPRHGAAERERRAP
ncbi:hypothetical protein SKAU_G00334610 [Synaphobranchus kaupii]|uniref:Uncharacterized protein n=1 Tax=Synaphobranchus kaupii TaxID=118154 RepID=A0A9Q1ELZ4_SYNKA|nr:hypothetical protein SKAU_G00334610 [Synaphobranchus kaupii]